MINAKIEFIEYEKKNGEKYRKMHIYVVDQNGELHEIEKVFVRDYMIDLINLVSSPGNEKSII